MSGDMILHEFFKVVQSNVNFNLTGILNITVQIKKIPTGSGRSKIYANMRELIIQKHCIIKLDNNDKMCAFRAIAISIDIINKKLINTQFTSLINSLQIVNDMDLQKIEAKKLANLINHDINNPASFDDIKSLMKALNEEFTCIIINGDDDSKNIKIGNKSDKYIALLYYDEHYWPVTSLAALYNKSYYCVNCNTALSCIHNHPCYGICKSCKSKSCKIGSASEVITSKRCKLNCQNNECYSLHLKKICSTIILCKICERRVCSNHVCIDQVWCKNCNKACDSNHKCYITHKELDRNIDEIFKGYVFFDYETYNDVKHLPNLVIAHYTCINCLKTDNCKTHQKEFIFYENESFCKWLFSLENVVAIAHNLKGYDGVFIMDYIIKNLTLIDSKPNVLVNGSKLLSIQFRKVKLIDSYSFIPIALADFPKTFNLKELKKGFFPHIFNKPENFNYIGSYPEKAYYSPEQMNEKKKIEFESWYETVKNNSFDFKKELESYCKSDVDILERGCLKFRELLMEISKKNIDDHAIDPFLHAITLPSFCHLIYRKLFMPIEL
jgi:hypothetical protein